MTISPDEMPTLGIGNVQSVSLTMALKNQSLVLSQVTGGCSPEPEIPKGERESFVLQRVSHNITPFSRTRTLEFIPFAQRVYMATVPPQYNPVKMDLQSISKQIFQSLLTESFTLRFWTRADFHDFLQNLIKAAGFSATVNEVFDLSGIGEVLEQNWGQIAMWLFLTSGSISGTVGGIVESLVNMFGFDTVLTKEGKYKFVDLASWYDAISGAPGMPSGDTLSYVEVPGQLVMNFLLTLQGFMVVGVNIKKEGAETISEKDRAKVLEKIVTEIQKGGQYQLTEQSIDILQLMIVQGVFEDIEEIAKKDPKKAATELENRLQKARQNSKGLLETVALRLAKAEYVRRALSMYTATVSFNEVVDVELGPSESGGIIVSVGHTWNAQGISGTTITYGGVIRVAS